MKTLGKFVLIDNQRKKETVLDWATNPFARTQGLSRIQDMNYNARKTIISDLHPFTHKKNDMNPFSYKQSDLNPFSQKHSDLSPFSHRLSDINTITYKTQLNSKPSHHTFVTSTSTKQIATQLYSNPQRERPNSEIKSSNMRATMHRTLSMKKINSYREPSLPKASIEEGELKRKIIEADKKKGKVISIISMRRHGLRFKMTHSFFVVSSETVHKDFLMEVKRELFLSFIKIPEKRVYLFHLGKQPINSICQDLTEREAVIFADVSPKFNISFQFQMKMFEQASILEDELKRSKESLDELKNEFMVEEQPSKLVGNGGHEWEKIKDVQQYVNKLVDNPEFALKMESDQEESDLIEKWCNEKSKKEDKSKLQKDSKQQKNPFFDVQAHFPAESSNPEALMKVANKINQLPQTQNRHDIKAKIMDNMMEKIKRQNERAEELRKKEEQKVKMIGFKSEKEVMRELDNKNVPLIRQNIPYIMAKYGITRPEAYNMFNLYKSLEKISAMRMFDTNEHRRVQEKGIDRKTFDEGLKGLEINAGDELIRNICYFPEFISWEQFIKIVSISMRKTPMSKLEALLQGLGNSQDGKLSEQQIDVMVGSSLHKIFGKEEPELRKHFVGVVMKEMDIDGSGSIQIDEVKDYVLKRSMEDMNLVTYLMLNS